MRFLFATVRPYLPYRVGGAEFSLDTLLKLLIEHGHTCETVVGLGSGWRRRLTRWVCYLSVGRRLSLRDRRNGYLTHRTTSQKVSDVFVQRLSDFQPDVVITQLDGAAKLAEIALNAGISVALMVRDVEFVRWSWPPPHPRLKFISNSRFVAGRLREQLGLQSTVIYPLIQMNNYKVPRRILEFVTFINPVRDKGIDLATQIATLLPGRRFLFVEGWPLKPRTRQKLRRHLRQFHNIRFTRRKLDVRRVYSRTAILIMPSQWEEAFGRVILEAQVNGIPVIGRDVGGIREILEPSGILLSRDAQPQVWANEIERLLDDNSWYAACSAQSLLNTTRPEFSPMNQLEKFLTVAKELKTRGHAVQAPFRRLFRGSQ